MYAAILLFIIKLLYKHNNALYSIRLIRIIMKTSTKIALSNYGTKD